MSFVFISLLIGVFAYYLKYKDEIIELKKYDYSEQDSLFQNASNSNYDQKEVDYKEELYDFSGNELESVFTKININSASEKKLVLLPGIGVKTAQKIIEYRETKGKFHTPNELLKVSGIGEKKIKKIKNLIIIE
ncbi:MAG: helix-hairpin-helix domain-containing protein [Melioribacteraceae bacterium]|nr:helix-hairpin-helix domain-containing protein [Melioribacteraceae bacterium]